jgi:hypothetical protein
MCASLGAFRTCALLVEVLEQCSLPLIRARADGGPIALDAFHDRLCSSLAFLEHAHETLQPRSLRCVPCVRVRELACERLHARERARELVGLCGVRGLQRRVCAGERGVLLRECVSFGLQRGVLGVPCTTESCKFFRLSVEVGRGALGLSPGELELLGERVILELPEQSAQGYPQSRQGGPTRAEVSLERASRS